VDDVANQDWRPARELAPYAADPHHSLGRFHPEPESRHRTPFERDRDRIIHSTAFRRLKQKTQVFVSHEGDHFRTRLTHSLEVAQIARSVARRLMLEEDLAEACALAHDLGHPPFGHTGEDALDACMRAYGGFDHNAQTMRTLTKLERRYPEFDGLNLTIETLEGVAKHNGPMLRGAETADNLPPVWRDFATEHDLRLGTFPTLEAQVAAMADDVAYNNHDIDDGLRAGLFTVDDLMDVPLARRAFQSVRERYPFLDEDRTIAEAVRRLIGDWVDDLVRETRRRLTALDPESAEDVRLAGVPLVGFSDDMTAKAAGLRQFLWERMYRHHKVNRVRSQARRIVKELFELFLAEPDTMPPDWQVGADGAHSPKTARIVADYIAGMTDLFAIDEHRRLFNLDRWL
jgi:dGTPase